MLTINQKKILIDGLCSCETSIFRTTPDSLYRQIIQGIPPYDGIDIVLITHIHFDHFAADKVAEFLNKNKKATVVSADEVIAEISVRLGDATAYNLIPVRPGLQEVRELAIKGTKVLVLGLKHEGKQFSTVQHLGFLVQDGVKVLHVGDAAASAENYQGLGLQEMNIDLLVAPFPYIGLSSARKTVKELINPSKTVLVHFPLPERDNNGWTEATMKSYGRMREDTFSVEFLQRPGMSVSF